MKCSALFILLVTLNVAARDPFSAVGVGRCPPSGETAVPWRLQGIIGRPGRYEAWLISPSEKRLHVSVHDRPAGSAWRVTGIDLWGINFADEHACLPPFRLTLKGEHHVKENSAGSGSG